MNQYRDTEVIINNRRYTISGYESEEYLQKIASFINNKHHEYKNRDAYKFLDSDLIHILMQINIADDYFKLKEKLKEMEEESEFKSNEIYDFKHEVISTQTKLDSAQKELEEVKNELYEAQKEIVRLETELNDMKDREEKR